jgi:hypothetical protein
MPKIVLQLRRRAGIPRSRRQARVAPPVYQEEPLRIGSLMAPLAGAVVATVSVAVPPLDTVIFTGVVEPKLKLGGYWAPAGPEVTAAVSATLPAAPPLGVTVTVEVFPVVAPGVTVTAVPLRVKVAAGQVIAPG